MCRRIFWPVYAFDIPVYICGVFVCRCIYRVVVCLFGLLHSYIHAGHGLARRPGHVRPRRSVDAVVFGSRHGRVRVRPRGTRVLGRERGTFRAKISDVFFLFRRARAHGEVFKRVRHRIVGDTKIDLQ